MAAFLTKYLGREFVTSGNRCLGRSIDRRVTSAVVHVTRAWSSPTLRPSQPRVVDSVSRLRRVNGQGSWRTNARLVEGRAGAPPKVFKAMVRNPPTQRLQPFYTGAPSLGERSFFKAQTQPDDISRWQLTPTTSISVPSRAFSVVGPRDCDTPKPRN
jgi:hypothetical protein